MVYVVIFHAKEAALFSTSCPAQWTRILCSKDSSTALAAFLFSSSAQWLTAHPIASHVVAPIIAALRPFGSAENKYTSRPVAPTQQPHPISPVWLDPVGHCVPWLTQSEPFHYRTLAAKLIGCLSGGQLPASLVNHCTPPTDAASLLAPSYNLLELSSAALVAMIATIGSNFGMGLSLVAALRDSSCKPTARATGGIMLLDWASRIQYGVPDQYISNQPVSADG